MFRITKLVLQNQLKDCFWGVLLHLLFPVCLNLPHLSSLIVPPKWVQETEGSNFNFELFPRYLNTSGGKTTEEEQSSQRSDILCLWGCRSKSLLVWIIKKHGVSKCSLKRSLCIWLGFKMRLNRTLLWVELCAPFMIHGSLNPRYLGMWFYLEMGSFRKVIKIKWDHGGGGEIPNPIWPSPYIKRKFGHCFTQARGQIGLV